MLFVKTAEEERVHGGEGPERDSRVRTAARRPRKARRKAPGFLRGSGTKKQKTKLSKVGALVYHFVHYQKLL